MTNENVTPKKLIFLIVGIGVIGTFISMVLGMQEMFSTEQYLSWADKPLELKNHHITYLIIGWVMLYLK